MKPSEIFEGENSSLYKTFQDINKMPEYNSFQLKVLTHALESLDTSNYDTGYKETHKHLLERFKKMI